jgi:hypothetical protein
MGLYLTVFDGEDELDGVEVGSYADFGFFRETVTRELEQRIPGRFFPTLILHSDSDGLWTPDQTELLERELALIRESLRKLPVVDFHSDWQRKVAKLVGLKPESLYDCFIDVDGEPLIERLIDLCSLARRVKRPILFQ